MSNISTPARVFLRPHKDFLPEFPFGRSQLFSLLRDRRFPAPKRLGTRTIAWPDSLIEEAKRQLLEHGDWSIDQINNPELKELAIKLAAEYWEAEDEAA